MGKGLLKGLSPLLMRVHTNSDVSDGGPSCSPKAEKESRGKIHSKIQALLKKPVKFPVEMLGSQDIIYPDGLTALKFHLKYTANKSSYCVIMVKDGYIYNCLSPRNLGSQINKGLHLYSHLDSISFIVVSVRFKKVCLQ